MIIGIDFDNTIACYDESMHRSAVARGFIAPGTPKNKRLIRNAIRALENGEAKWRALQVYSYGPGMSDARPMAGVKEFMHACKRRGIAAAIVSHKTEYANFGDPTVNLRDAAMRWLERQGFVDSREFGVGREQIYFASTRAEKLVQIAELGVTHFVDDLEETFLEESFPQGVEQILYAPLPTKHVGGHWREFDSWPAIQRYLLR